MLNMKGVKRVTPISAHHKGKNIFKKKFYTYRGQWIVTKLIVTISWCM